MQNNSWICSVCGGANKADRLNCWHCEKGVRPELVVLDEAPGVTKEKIEAIEGHMSDKKLDDAIKAYAMGRPLDYNELSNELGEIGIVDECIKARCNHKEGHKCGKKNYPLMDNIELHANIERWHNVVERDIETLIEKDTNYGSSWKRRGGVGAFMMMARKHDRLELIWKLIEEQSKKENYDIFEAIDDDPRDENILDDIRDLRCYLILVEAEVMRRRE